MLDTEADTFASALVPKNDDGEEEFEAEHTSRVLPSSSLLGFTETAFRVPQASAALYRWECDGGLGTMLETGSASPSQMVRKRAQNLERLAETWWERMGRKQNVNRCLPHQKTAERKPAM